MTQELNHSFQLLDMLAPNGGHVDNLIPVHLSGKNLDYGKYDFEDFHVDKIIALEGAARYNVDYVYFRAFLDRPPTPQIFIYNFTDKEYNEKELTELHRRLWSAVQVPMFYVLTKTEIKIFNAFKAPIEGKKIVSKPLEVIELAAIIDEKISAFSAKKIDNGAFWENPIYAGSFKFSGSAYEQLLAELKNTLKDIIKEKILSDEKVAKKLLIRAILIKYLEERKDESGKTVFPKKGNLRQYENGNRRPRKFDKDFFEDFAKDATSFTNVLEKTGACVELFKYLSKHFNGEIFKLDANEETILKDANLNRLIPFLEGNLKGRQYSLWELYSFDDLPIELISNVYEEFLEAKPGVVYTPPYLVNFLLEESMPLNGTAEDFKIIDPACGSGVFLVGAYKRLIYRWRANNNWKRPPLESLKRILKENIFGVDIELEAVNLAMFSLSLALCDELSPIAIWDELKFDNLKNSNLFDRDFFELIEEDALPKDFDLVIGNPPFKPKLIGAAKRVEDSRKKERNIEIEGINENVKIPGDQIALLFLDQAINLCKEKGFLCLILPSTDFLYNHNSDKFRTYFLTNFRTPQILDFTNLSGCLFGNANVSVIALFAQNQLPDEIDSIQHITIRRNHVAEERIFFELDYYDFHSIPFDGSISKSFIWKANLFGGGRLGRLLSKLNNIKPNLGKFLKDKKIDKAWRFGEGFILGDRKKIELRTKYENGELTEQDFDTNDLKKLLKDYKPADWLTNKPFIDKDFIMPDGIDTSRIVSLDEPFFHRRREPRQNEIFCSPHIILKKVISNHKIPIDFIEEYLVFNHSLVGIHAPEEEKDELFKLYDQIKNNPTFVFHIITNSSSFGVSQKNTTAIYKEDFDKLPFPSEDLDKIKLSAFEEILRDDSIEYWLDYIVGLKTSNLPLFKDVEEKDLEKFGKIFCNILNSVYEDFHAHQPIETENFICYPFYIGETPHVEFPNKENLEEHLNQLLVKENPRANLRITRIMRIYDFNIIYLIKPKQLKYWLRSVAIRDADATFADMVAQEYQL